jgi:hypothetical protein
MSWRWPAREAAGREVERTPEEVPRARFANEPSPEQAQKPVGPYQRGPEPPSGLRVVRAVLVVVKEWDRPREPYRAGQHRDVHAEILDGSHHVAVEDCDQSGLEDDTTVGAAGGVDPQHMLGEVEPDLQAEPPGVHERRGEAPIGHVQRDPPPVIDHRLQGQTDLADYLGPQVQRVAGVRPAGEGLLRPAAGHIGVIHVVQAPLSCRLLSTSGTIMVVAGTSVGPASGPVVSDGSRSATHRLCRLAKSR